MNCQHAADRLQDYADGSLSEVERRQLDSHVAECGSCRDEVTATRALLADLRALPREVAVEASEEGGMWAAIAQGISAGQAVRRVEFRRRLRSRVAVGMAAAAVLVTVAVPTTQWLERQTGGELAADPHNSRHRLVSTTSHAGAIADEYGRSMAELWSALRHQRSRLTPDTVQVLEENLRIIDAALRESQAALAADPSQRELLRSVAAMHETKLRLLRGAVRSRRI